MVLSSRDVWGRRMGAAPQVEGWPLQLLSGEKKMDSESQDVDKCAESSLPQKPAEKEKRWSVHEADFALAVNLSVKCQWLWCWQKGSIIVPGKQPQCTASHVNARP